MLMRRAIDTGQNVSFEDQAGFLEGYPVLDLIGDILPGIPYVAHDQM